MSPVRGRDRGNENPMDKKVTLTNNVHGDLDPSDRDLPLTG
jgi:hypothetical protein